MPGIYIISGLAPGVPECGDHAYFGLSVDPERRLHHHRRMMQRGRHPNTGLQAFHNEFGRDHFYYAIVEECDQDQLAARERHHIALGRTFLNPRGFNETAGGEGATPRDGKLFYFEDQGNGLFITGQNLAHFARANPHLNLGSLYQLSLGHIDSYKGLVRKDWQA